MPARPFFEGIMMRRALAAWAAVTFLCTIPAAAAPPCSIEDGQRDIDSGRYESAIREFSCVIAAAPTEIDGYRGRIEAQLLAGLYSDAVRDYARVAAVVVPVHPDAITVILAHYADRLAADPASVPALTGASFAYWWNFQYSTAILRLDDLLSVRPADVYGLLFRGSSRMLGGSQHLAGAADLERAIVLAPASPDVRFVVADAYTYGQPNPERALAEATHALEWKLNTPRVQAILGAANNALGHEATAAAHISAHIAQVTAEMSGAPVLMAGDTLNVSLVPYRTFDIPLPVSAGELISVRTWNNQAFFDTILVVLGPDGTPVLGADDFIQYLAGFDWVAPAGGPYRLRVTSFEGVGTGTVRITRR